MPGTWIILKSTRRLPGFAKPALELPGLPYVGLDIIKNTKGEYCLLEINSGPKYDHYVQAQGTEGIIAMYERIFMKESAMQGNRIIDG